MQVFSIDPSYLIAPRKFVFLKNTYQANIVMHYFNSTEVMFLQQIFSLGFEMNM
jgi:hypothetical protein